MIGDELKVKHAEGFDRGVYHCVVRFSGRPLLTGDAALGKENGPNSVCSQCSLKVFFHAGSMKYNAIMQL